MRLKTKKLTKLKKLKLKKTIKQLKINMKK